MSFGFSIGDFIAVIQLANDVRKQFVDAPSQFKAISEEVKSLSIVLQDIDDILPARDLTSHQERELGNVIKNCRSVLQELDKILIKFKELDPVAKGADGKPRRLWKRFIWDQKDVNELRSRISSNILLLNTFLGQVNSQTVFAIRDGVKLLHKRQDTQERKQETREQQQEHETVLNWLTPLDFVSQQNDFIARRQEGTGTWLLDSIEYQSWQETKNQTLFCPGIPGAGKTILSSIVVNDLTTRFFDDPNIGIAYIYCNFRRQDEQKINDLLASLLKQLAEGQPSLPAIVKELYNRHKTKRTRPSLNEISASLQAVAAAYSRVFIIVDALDECQTSYGCRNRFLSEMFSLQTKTRANLFTTSRFIPEITENFKESLRLEIRASNQDIERYLDSHMLQLPGCVLRNSDLQDEIKTAIIKAVDGMFLLAQLHLDSLKGKKSPKAIRIALQKLPTGSEAYDYAYKDAMERIEGQLADEEDLAKQALSWITCAKRPLTTSELEHALAVEINEPQLDTENLCQVADIVSICAGLVTVDEESGIIRLVHYTAQEYFERTQRQWFPNAQVNITTICVSYLSFNEFESGSCQNDDEFEKRLQSNKLYDYASHNWGHHAQEASTSIPEVLSFLERKSHVEASSQGLLAEKRYSFDTEYSQRFPKNMTGLHLAVYFGVRPVVTLMLEKGAAVDAADSYGWTPLHWASENGDVEVVRLLLAQGAAVNAADRAGRTPLYWASRNGDVEVVRLLLARGAAIDAATSSGGTPLYWASRNGDVEVIRLLLARGAAVDAADSDGLTPLHWASRNGHVEVVRLLLPQGAAIDAATSSGGTPLYWASRNGHVEVVRLLLPQGAAIDAADSDGWTSLHWASENGDVEVVRLLLAHSAAVDAAKSSGGTPLYRASRNGHVEVVRLLLAQGAAVDAAKSSGGTPLYWASENGHVEVVRLLLAQGAAVNTADRAGRTPLYWASRNGDVEVIRLLLARGAAVNAANSDGLTPLHWASRNGHVEVVRLLLAQGADLGAKDNNSQAPLSWAAKNEHKAVIALLLEKNADVIN